MNPKEPAITSLLRQPAQLALLAANLVPLAGVLWFGWDTFVILLLFWLENVVVGAYNALRMAVAGGGKAADKQAKFFLIPFFCVHFGGFTLGHGLFLFTVFGGIAGLETPSMASLLPVVRDQIAQHNLLWPLLAMWVSHGVSFVTNTLASGELRDRKAADLIGRPYGRIAIMHLVALGGGFAAQATGNSLPALILLIGLKTVFDLRAHRRERKLLRSAQSPDPEKPEVYS